MIIKKSEYITSNTIYVEQDFSYTKEYLFCGRSNVGKSSFINALCNNKNLARTSQSPGKTQTLNFYNINDLVLFVDVPGYGFAKVSKEKRKDFGKMIEHYIKNTKRLNIAFLLVDFRHQTEDDILMYEYLIYNNLNVYVIATKSDKVKNKDRNNLKLSLYNKFNIDSKKVIITSSSNKEGISLVRQLIN